jgi:molybdate transport system substrate-binding protein
LVAALALFIAHVLGRGESLDVFAAASLHEAFVAISKHFEASHPGVTVRLNFGGSQQLAAQVSQGAPCDVFASADERNLDKIAYDPSTRRVFALNHLVVVCPAGRSGIASFRALPNVKSLIIAAPQVPVGAYSRYALEQASKVYGVAWLRAIDGNTVSKEQDVRQVLAKVVLGEAAAGIVYVTDAISAGSRVRSVPIPARFQPRIVYPVAVNRNAANPELARAFIQSLLSSAGQEELRRRGFLSPR